MAEQTLQVTSFEGGMTDNYIGANPVQFQRATNLVIRPDKKLQSRPAISILTSSYYQLPYSVSPKRVDSITRFKDTSMYQTQNKLYHIKALGFTQVTGPTGNPAFPSSVAEFNQSSAAEWNNHLVVTNDARTRPVVVYRDGVDFRMFTLGLPRVVTSGITFGSGTGADRAYVFVYAYTYTIDGIEFVQRGPASLPRDYTGAIPHNITTLPVLTNTASDNYDTAAIKLEIYRTDDTGDLFYKVGEVTNGATSFTDAVADIDLDVGIILYTDAEDLDYDQPPKCKFVVQNNNCFYFMNIEDSRSDVYPNRIVQAAPDQPYAANEGNQLDVDQAITGGGVAGQSVIVFTEDRTYRLDGFYDSTGAGGISKTELSRNVGCISHKSIVQVHGQDGSSLVAFAAKDGFYFTDGYKVLRISENIPISYAACVITEAQRKRIYGTYDSFNKRVYWAATSNNDNTDNDTIFVAHLYWGVGDSVPFTTFDGGYWASNFTPTALTFYSDTLVHGDARGFLLKYQDGTLNDALTDNSIAASLWKTVPLIYDYRSVATDFGDVTNRKYVTKIAVYADAIAKSTFTISSSNDNTGIFTDLAPLKSNSPALWGDTPVPLWGDSSLRWSYSPIISGLRRFPGGDLRCSFKQIRITNTKTLIDDSGGGGTVTLNGAANTVTLDTAGVTWLDEPEEYFISFSTDTFEREYRILARTSDTVLTVEDGINSLPTTSGVSYKIMGYRKNEALRLLSYSLIYSLIGATQTPYRAS